jgi:hypothetical protein
MPPKKRVAAQGASEDTSSAEPSVRSSELATTRQHSPTAKNSIACDYTVGHPLHPPNGSIARKFSRLYILTMESEKNKFLPGEYTQGTFVIS